MSLELGFSLLVSSYIFNYLCISGNCTRLASVEYQSSCEATASIHQHWSDLQLITRTVHTHTDSPDEAFSTAHCPTTTSDLVLTNTSPGEEICIESPSPETNSDLVLNPSAALNSIHIEDISTIDDKDDKEDRRNHQSSQVRANRGFTADEVCPIIFKSFQSIEILIDDNQEDETNELNSQIHKTKSYTGYKISTKGKSQTQEENMEVEIEEDTECFQTEQSVCLSSMRKEGSQGPEKVPNTTNTEIFPVDEIVEITVGEEATICPEVDQQITSNTTEISKADFQQDISADVIQEIRHLDNVPLLESISYTNTKQKEVLKGKSLSIFQEDVICHNFVDKTSPRGNQKLSTEGHVTINCGLTFEASIDELSLQHMQREHGENASSGEINDIEIIHEVRRQEDKTNQDLVSDHRDLNTLLINASGLGGVNNSSQLSGDLISESKDETSRNLDSTVAVVNGSSPSIVSDKILSNSSRKYSSDLQTDILNILNETISNTSSTNLNSEETESDSSEISNIIPRSPAKPVAIDLVELLSESSDETSRDHIDSHAPLFNDSSASISNVDEENTLESHTEILLCEAVITKETVENISPTILDVIQSKDFTKTDSLGVQKPANILKEKLINSPKTKLNVEVDSETESESSEDSDSSPVRPVAREPVELIDLTEKENKNSQSSKSSVCNAFLLGNCKQSYCKMLHINPHGRSLIRREIIRIAEAPKKTDLQVVYQKK